MVRQGPKIVIGLKNGENLTMQVTDFFSPEGKLEIVAHLPFKNGVATVYKADSISLKGWTEPGPAVIPPSSIFMDCDKNREFRLPANRDGELGEWLQECCKFSGALDAYYTPKYDYFNQ